MKTLLNLISKSLSLQNTICWWQVTHGMWHMTFSLIFLFFSFGICWYWYYYPHTSRFLVSPVCGSLVTQYVLRSDRTLLIVVSALYYLFCPNPIFLSGQKLWKINIFTESAPRLIQSIGCDVRVCIFLFVCVIASLWVCPRAKW